MKQLFTIVTILLLSGLVLAGCGPASTPAPSVANLDAASVTTLDVSYENALTARNQLLLGTLNLEGTDQAISTEQAATLLALWQGLRATTNSGASAQAEVDALLAQVEDTMQAGQTTAIRAMNLTQADLQEWAQSQGISSGSGEFASEAGSGVGGGQGSGQSLTPEERATRQAERGGAGSNGGVSKALMDAVIALLESK